jgi:hypothetical protein
MFKLGVNLEFLKFCWKCQDSKIKNGKYQH